MWRAKSCFLWLTMLLAVSCMEYSIENPNKLVPGIPNPPQLENRIKKDVITQIAKAEVDVLWVVDNSCSMIEEQT